MTFKQSLKAGIVISIVIIGRPTGLCVVCWGVVCLLFVRVGVVYVLCVLSLTTLLLQRNRTLRGFADISRYAVSAVNVRCRNPATTVTFVSPTRAPEPPCLHLPMLLLLLLHELRTLVYFCVS